MNNKFAFCLWIGPQYKFAYGIATESQIQLTWIEKIGLCDFKCTSLTKLFTTAAKHQGLGDRIEGVAMTAVSDEMYEMEMTAITRCEAIKKGSQ